VYRGKTFLGFIPARAGSQGIIRKNLQRVGDETILARSIRHLKESEYVDHIIISTNGDEIKKEAWKCGAQIITRPEEISGPLSLAEEALNHAIQTCKKHHYIVFLQATSPFRSKGLIDRCIRRIVDEGGDSLLTTWRFHDFCFYYKSEGGMLFSTYDYIHRPMRQELTLSEFKEFDCGNLYLTRTNYFLESQCRLGGKLLLEPVSTLESIQIDDEIDLEMCQKIAKGDVN